MSKGGGGGTSVVMTGSGDLKKPLNLLSAVSEIEQTASMEKDFTMPVDKKYLTTVFRLDFLTIGLRNSLVSGLISLFLTPVSIGVFYKLIRVFNDPHISLFDEIFILIVNFSLSIGFGLFLSKVKECYVGTMSKGMIKSLLGGFALGELIKVIVAFILFNWIYLELTTRNIYNLCLFFKLHFNSVPKIRNINYVYVFNWLNDFRNVFPVSAILILISSIFVIGIPLVLLQVQIQKQKID